MLSDFVLDALVLRTQCTDHGIKRGRQSTRGWRSVAGLKQQHPQMFPAANLIKQGGAARIQCPTPSRENL